MSDAIFNKYEKAAKARCRVRDLGIQVGRHPTGPHNAITDVKGVKVGHKTVIEGTGKKKPGTGPVRSGVTVIIPSDRVYDRKLMASGFILNGAGEVGGLTQLTEWGLIETPIALTNTMSVGRVSDAVIKWMSKKYERLWDERQVIIPVVGECDDSFLHDAIGMHIKEKDVFDAFDSAKSGPVAEGAVGSGTGMICCDLKAGIGTSSRVVTIEKEKYTVGVLVMTNFGVMEDLRFDGFPLGEILSRRQGQYNRRVDNYGSIIVVIATDLPLNSIQIQRICKRSALGIGRVGTYAAHGSGEIIIGFSTANTIKLGARSAKHNMLLIGDEFLNDTYQATIEATEEAILNAMTAAVDMEGADGHFVPAIDLDFLRTYVGKMNSVMQEYK